MDEGVRVHERVPADGTGDTINQGLRDRWWLLLFLTTIVAWVLLFQMNYTSDGERYLAWLRSTVCDGDLNFYNEYTLYTFNPSGDKGRFLARTETGYLWNGFSIGPALLWSPFYLVGHVLTLVLAWCGYPIVADGYSFPCLLAIAIGTLFYTLLGLSCCFLLCRRFLPGPLAAVSVFLMYWSSPAPAYLLREPAMGHSHSFALIALFLLLWADPDPEGRPMTARWRYMLLALIGGLAALVRWQNCLVLVFPLFDIVRDGIVLRRSSIVDRHTVPEQNGRRALFLIVGMGTFSLLAMAPQLIGWKIIFGSFLTIPQGEQFMHWWRPAMRDVLFSPLNGLLVWHPLYLAGLAGLIVALRKRRHLAVAGLIFFCFQWYINACVDDWWAGASFGNRRFVNCLPFMMIGLASLLGSLKPRVRVVFLVLVPLFALWNGILFARSYGGDLRGSVPLTVERLFSSMADWPVMAARISGTGYFLRMMTDGVQWPYAVMRFAFPLILVLIFGVMYGILRHWSALTGCVETSASTAMTSKRDCLAAKERRIVLLLGIVLAGCSLVLAWQSLRAGDVYPVHLGEDAFGRIERLRLASPGKYSGSLTPLHISAGDSRRIALASAADFDRLWIIATTSGDGPPEPDSHQVALIQGWRASGEVLEWRLDYPADVDRMDRGEYALNESGRARIAFSWYRPTLQRVPHSWYLSDSNALAGGPLVTLLVSNTSTNMVLHVTGLAFDDD